MRKRNILLGLLGLVVVAVFIQGASAYHNVHGVEYGIDFHEGTFSNSYRYVDNYNAPFFRVYTDFDYGSRYDFNSRDRFQRRRAVAWVLNSYDRRYDVAFGRTSADVFCGNCRVDSNPTSFANKRAYDYRTDGRGSYQGGYYYEPQRDSQFGYWNWN